MPGLPKLFNILSFIQGKMPIGSQMVNQAAIFWTHFPQRLCAYWENGAVNIEQTVNLNIRTSTLDRVVYFGSGFCAPITWCILVLSAVCSTPSQKQSIKAVQPVKLIINQMVLSLTVIHSLYPKISMRTLPTIANSSPPFEDCKCIVHSPCNP